MHITQVRYVLAVAKYGNFSRAAESLFLTQPALSLQIKRLEAELGLSLLRRTPKGVFLTEDGQVFCAQGQQVMDAWEALGQRMAERKARPAGRLRIGVGPRVYANDLFEPMVRFLDEHPELSVTFVTDLSDNIMADLAEGRLELALDRLPPADLIPDPERFAAWDLVRERQCILLSPDDPRSQSSELPFEALQGSTIVTGSEGSMEEQIILQDCRNYGITLMQSYRSDNVSTIMRLVRSGKGLVMGPASFASYFGVAAVPVLPETYISLSFICLKREARDSRLTLLRKFLLDYCAQRAVAPTGAVSGTSGIAQEG